VSWLAEGPRPTRLVGLLAFGDPAKASAAHRQLRRPGRPHDSR